MEGEAYIYFRDETMNTPDWSRWENHVLAEIKRLNDNIEKVISENTDLAKKYFDLREQVTIIKVRIAVFASLFGFGGSLVVPLFQWLFSQLKS